MPPKKPVKKKTANGYKMPDPIPAGINLQTINLIVNVILSQN